MIRKKSNVKALALAVTCAILAGGYSGLNPVYAGSDISKDTSTGTITITGSEIAGALSSEDISKAKVKSTIDTTAETTIDSIYDKVLVNTSSITSLSYNTQKISYNDSNSKTTIDSDTMINGELTANNKLTLTNANGSAYLDVDQVGKLSQLVNSTMANQKTVIDAGDGSKVGGVEFNAGAVTGVKSINADDSSAKFKVTQDDSSYMFRAGNFQVTTGKENGYLNGEITFADTNRPNKSDEITLSEIIATRNKTDVINNIKTSGDESYESTKIRDVLEVRNDGKVNIDGKLTAGSDSKIGNITISDGQLSTSYSGAEGGIARVNVTDLYDDHKIITEDTTNTYSSKNVRQKIDSLEQSRTNLGEKIEKIERFTNNDNNKQGTSIAGNFDVYDDGTVIINNGQTQQVTIDSNGIKVGTGSAYINNDGFKAGADGKNSLTTSGLTAKEIRAGNDNTEFFVDGGGNVVANGTLSAAGSKFFVSSDGNITASGSLSVAGDKFRVNADGSINANNKFIVGEDGSLRASDDKFTADTDGNVRAIGSLSAANDKFQVATDGSINVNQKFIVDADGTISSEGTLSAAGGNFSVDADGALKAANNNFTVSADGKLMSANGSQIGGVTIDGEKLSAGTASITVSQLEKDNALVNDSKKGNESLYTGLGSVQTLANSLDTRTAGISRDTTGTATTTIEGKLKVGSDGTVKINEGDDQQVIIDSNGIKVGKNSSRMNDSYGFATTRDLYVGADSADAPTKDGSKFYVDGSNGSVKAADGQFEVNQYGDVTATGQIKSGKLAVGENGTEFDVDEKGNIIAKGFLKVADDKFEVDADGSVTAKGTLKVADGKFDVDADGNVTASGQLRSTKLAAGTNGDEFTVDENGNVVAKGTLSAADGKFEVDADGAVSAAGGNFGVDKDGNTTVGGTLNVTGDTTLGGNLGVTGNATVGGTLNVTGDTTFGGNLGVTGNTTVGGTLNSKGNFSVGNNDEFTVDASNGDVVSKGKITSSSATIGTVGITDTGVITGVSSLTTDALIVNGALNINGDITGKTINGDSLAITGNGTIGGSLSVTGAITGATINGATITTDSFNGAKISSNKFNGVTLDTNGDISGKDINAAGKINGATITDNSFNGVTMSNGNVTGGTITGTTVTDGAGASMNAGTVTANKFTDGQGFTANGGNVNAKDVTATGTVTGTTLTDGVATMKGGKVTAQNGFEVDANNSLTSSGLKAANIDAAKATIGKIKIEGSKITSTEADGTVGLAGITVNAAGAVNNVTSIDGVAVAGSTASGLTVGSGATAVTIGGNSMALSSTNFGVDNDGDVTGQSFTAGNSYLKDGELKLNDANIWTTAEGIKAEKATIGANTLDSTGFSTTGTLGVAGKATFGSNAGDSTTIEQGAVSVTQNGKTTTIKGGEIETDKLTVNDIVLKNSMKDGSGNTITISGTDGSMSVASGAFAVDKEGQLTNKITGTEGGYTYATNLATSKTGINANYTNGVNGNNNLLSINKDGVALGVTDSTNQKLGGFAANEDNASLSYGDDNSIVVDETTITSALGSDVSTTLTNDGTDQSIVSKVTDNATSTIKADSIEDKVGTAKRSLTEAEIVDDVAGMTVKTNADGTLFTNGTNSTLINGSKLTSTNGAATGVLDGSNLTLTDGNKSTTMEAGKVTFKSETAGEHGGTETTIDGGTITTDTLNVERINLGGELLDSNGNPAGGNLSMDKEGNFSAAGGNFKLTGGSGADKGAMTNTVGNTTLKTDTTGAGMSYAGSVNSNVSIADGKANVSAGVGSIDVTNESITSKVGTDASSTITADSITDKVGGTTVETKDGSFSVKGNGGNGMNIDTNTGKTTFTGASGTTTIDGSTITTGKLITDELVITGQGDAAGDGKGSLAFGGNGTIKSDVKDGSDKNTQFTTDIDGVTTKVTDGTNTTTNEVAAAGNTNTVTNGTATSKNTQIATSIGGVITNGTVKIAQTLDGENGTITNEVTDKDGNSSKLEQNGTGLTYTDSANADNATRIDSKDVSIGSATDDSKRINLSDLGQIDDLDTELSARDEFKDNPTAVGGINAEAAARRADVARLDNRIDDVNERVDKVGAMAAAIASLKSIGYDPQAPSEFSVGLGQYKGETGVALGFFHYPNKNFMINVSLSTAGGETMGGIGATWRFGHKSPQKLLDEQREAQAKKELAAAEKYKAAAQLAKEAQERAEYAAKLARQAQVSADNAKAAADATQAKHLK